MNLILPASGEALHPGKLICIGRNYAAHARELNNPVPKKEPVVFLKPASALIGTGEAIIIPRQSKEVHHEVELVVVIGKAGTRIAREAAFDHVVAYAVGLDMTARDLQREAKKKGLPWSIAKGFDTFAPLGPLQEAGTITDPHHLDIQLTINGEARQQGHTAQMLFSIPELIVFCSGIFTLAAGDLLFTGTPAGVGPVQAGDILEATITGLPALRVSVAGAEV